MRTFHAIHSARRAGRLWSVLLVTIALSPTVSQRTAPRLFPPISLGPTLRASFAGTETTDTGLFASDSHLAVSPSRVIVVTNGTAITIRNRLGALIAETSLFVFFSSVRRANNVGDPTVNYDHFSGRLFVQASSNGIRPSNCTSNCISDILLAVSKNQNPATLDSRDWYFYRFDATLDGTTPNNMHWADRVTVGLDNNVLYFAANMIRFSDNMDRYEKIRILDKSNLINGASAPWIDIDRIKDPSTGANATSLRPTIHFETTDTIFLVGFSGKNTSAGNVSCDLIVYGIQNALTSPILSTKLATAPGSCNNITSADLPCPGAAPLSVENTFQLGTAVYRNKSLWTTRTSAMDFGRGPVAIVRWYEIDASTWPNSLSTRQVGILGSDGVSHFHASVMVDAGSNMIIAFHRTGTSEGGSVYYAGRHNSDLLNTLRDSKLLRAGQACLNSAEPGSDARYGDYTGSALDPVDGTFWVVGEYVRTPGSWGTWVGNVAWSQVQ